MAQGRCSGALAALIVAACGGGGGSGGSNHGGPPPDPFSGVDIVLPAKASLEEAVRFDLAGGGANTFQYSWDFGDGETAGTAQPAHDFRNPGSYAVRLQLTTSGGQTKTLSKVLTVEPWAYLSGSECSSGSKGGWCLVNESQLGAAESVYEAAFVNPSSGWGATGASYKPGAAWVHRTSDGGQSWASTQLRHAAHRLGAVNASTVWALSDGHRASFSVDGGRTFSEVSLPVLAGAPVSGLMLLKGERLVVRYQDGRLQVSSDRGATWKAGRHDPNVSYRGKVRSIHGQRGLDLDREQLWTIDGGALAASSDGGVSYQPVAAPPGECALDTLSVVGTRQLILKPLIDGGKGGRVCVSSDAGAHWTVLPALPQQHAAAVDVRSDGGYFTQYWESSNVVAAVTDASLTRWVPFGPYAAGFANSATWGVIDATKAYVDGTSHGANRWTSVTMDAGKTWTLLRNLPAAEAAVFDPAWIELGSGGVLREGRFETTTVGIQISADAGASWRELKVQRPMASSTGPVLFADARLGMSNTANPPQGLTRLSITRDGGRSWSQTAYERARLLATDPSGALWVTVNDALIVSRDRGSSWQTVRAPSSTVYAMDVRRGDWILLGTQGIESSTDGGKTWLSTAGSGAAEVVRTLEGGRGIAVVNRYAFPAKPACVHVTSDQGQRWSDCLPLGAGTVVRAAAHIGSDVWLVGDGGVMHHSADAGQSWQVVNLGVEEQLNDIRFADAKRGWVVGARGLVLSTQDGGKTWKQQVRMTEADLLRISPVNDKLVWLSGEGVLLGTATAGE